MELIDRAKIIEFFDAFIADYPKKLFDVVGGNALRLATTDSIIAFTVSLVEMLKSNVADAPTIVHMPDIVPIVPDEEEQGQSQSRQPPSKTNNDLIRRNEAKLECYREWRESRGEAGIVDYQAALDRVPAVSQPMSAVEYARNFGKMCRSHTCRECPLRTCEKFSAESCVKFEMEHPEEAVAIVQKWAAENKA